MRHVSYSNAILYDSTQDSAENMYFFISAGLQTAYCQHRSLYRHLRKMLALPFLPAEHIEAAFTELRGAIDDERVLQLEAYIELSWLSSSTWSVGEWSVFMKPVRTNNDCEGWHRRLNVRARRGMLPFYLLVELLYEEARLVQLTAMMVSDKRLKRYQRKVYASVQSKLFALWDDYLHSRRTTSSLLRACSQFYEPMLN